MKITRLKIISMFLVTFVFLSLLPVVSHAINLPIYINGTKASFPTDQLPYVSDNSRTMVSIRGMSEELGYNVVWNGSNQSVEVTYGTNKAVLPLNQNIIIVNGKNVTIDAKPEVVNQRVYVPLRSVVEAMGATVGYDGSTGNITIKTDAVATTTTTYTVVSGDTLFSISQKFNISVDTIKTLNGLTSDTISVGQKLNLVFTPKKATVKVNGSLVIRSGAGTTYGVIGSLYNGNVVDVINEQGDWSQIKYGNVTGWTAKSYLVDGVVTTPTTPTTPTVKKATVKADSLNVRSGAGTTYGIVGSLSNGTVIDVLQESGNWAQMQYGSLKGWVSKDYIVYGTSTTTPSPTGSLKGKIIVLDPGHGGSDAGAVGVDGTYEKTLTLLYANDIKTELQALGATVYMTRTGDTRCGGVYDATTNADLKCRTDFASAKNANILISVHMNWTPGATGSETYYNETNTYDGHVNPYPAQSKLLAQSVHKYYRPAVNLPDRGVQNANLYVNRMAKMPSTLIEVGFISNSYDLGRIKQTTVRQAVAKGIAQGVVEYYSKVN